MNVRNTLSNHVRLGLAFLAACSDAGLDVDASRGGGHGSFEELELAVAETDEVLATWSLEGGWRDGSGAPTDVLPPAVLEDGSLQPLRAGGPPASLRVRMGGTRAPDLAPLDDAEANGGNPCGEFSARYFPLDDETTVIAWPNTADPDTPSGPALYAERSDGELVQVFFCDRVEIYPEQPGTSDLQLVLWHVNHADQASDSLAIEVAD